jgi:tetratricopeptide (TPR) repeat protein
MAAPQNFLFIRTTLREHRENEPMAMSTSNSPNHLRPGAVISRLGLRPALVGLVLAVITSAVFWPVRNCDFINLDDSDYFFANSQVQKGLTPGGLVWAFTTDQTGNWHPLTWLSLMLDAALFEGRFAHRAAGPHLMNVLWHVANTVLLFLVLRALTSAHWRSAFVAALFGLHPLHVESVAWIAERKDVLCGFFFLLTLRCYAKAVTGDKWQVTRTETTPSPIGSRVTGHASPFYRLALLCFALGLMSKPMAVTLPFVLLLLDYWPLNRFPGHRFDVSTFRQLVKEKIPFFILSAVSCVITLSVQQHSGAVRSLENLSMGVRVENALVSYARYLGKAFWPGDLVVIYPYPEHWPPALVILAVALVVGLSAGVFWLRRFQPFLVTGWFWFLGTLIPVIGLVQVGQQSMADRYTYVPLIGVFMVVTWGVAALAARWRVPTVAVAVTAALVLGACAARAADQVRYWQNSGTLFRHAIALTQNNYLAHDSLGIYLYANGNQEAAMAEFRRALQINPRDANALDGLSAGMVTRHQYAEADRYLQRLLQIRPQDPVAHYNYGAVLALQGRWNEAAAELSEALRLKPDFVEARQLRDSLSGRHPP